MHSLRRTTTYRLTQIQLNKILHARCRAAGIPPIYTTTSLRIALPVQGGITGQRSLALSQQTGLRKTAVERYMKVGRDRRQPGVSACVRQAPTTNRRSKAALHEVVETLELRRKDILALFNIDTRDYTSWKRKGVPSHRRFDVLKLWEFARDLTKGCRDDAPEVFRRKSPEFDDRSLLELMVERGIERVTHLVAINPFIIDALMSPHTPPPRDAL